MFGKLKNMLLLVVVKSFDFTTNGSRQNESIMHKKHKNICHKKQPHSRITLLSHITQAPIMNDKGVKFGGTIPMGSPTLDAYLSLANQHKATGFTSLWSGDHLLHLPPRTTIMESWTYLTAIGCATSEVTVASLVSDPHRYHPAVLAQRMATLSTLTENRVILGLGAGTAMNLDPFGIEWDRPVSRLIEYVLLMKRLWSGETFSYDGEFWSFTDAHIMLPPTDIPIYFAANSPRMLRVTGRSGDGWIPFLITPKMYSDSLSLIEESAKKSGRMMSDITPGLYVLTSIADTTEQAQKQLDPFKHWLSPELVRAAGYDIHLPEDLVNEPYIRWLGTEEQVAKNAQYSEFVPKEAFFDVCVVGTVDECIAQFESFYDAGVRLFVPQDVGPDQEKVRKIFGEKIIPHFSEFE
jgi:alkanesulfonate monooxygenase SsuD/methylene tetrahydromethanopterin reductase-like flavin-dependent oxidoreductase (luciferase family)